MIHCIMLIIIFEWTWKFVIHKLLKRRCVQNEVGNTVWDSTANNLFLIYIVIMIELTLFEQLSVKKYFVPLVGASIKIITSLFVIKMN